MVPMINRLKSQRGAAMLFFVLFFVVAASALAFSLGRAVYSDLYLVNSLLASNESYLTADSALEDAVYKMMKGYMVSATSTFNATAGLATTTISYDSSSDIYTLRSVSKVGRANRVSVVELTSGVGSAFNYGLQSGNGGFTLSNSASITGNVYSNGNILGGGSSLISGDVISAGPTGSITKIHATGSVWTNTLSDSLIDKDAHYNVVGIPSVVNGVRYTPEAVTATTSLPIPDDKVQEYKDGVTSSGTVIPVSSCIAGWYVISTNATIGNVKIECNLRIKGPGITVTLTGPIWVTGNIEFVTGPTLKVSPALGPKSVQFIADNPSDRLTSSKVSINNSSVFTGSGHPSSFIMVLSQNNSAETGGSEEAAFIGQSSNGSLILYAGHGLINIGNSIDLKSVTGYKIDIGNNSDVTYDTGLTSVLFTGGPGGGYVIRDWYQK